MLFFPRSALLYHESENRTPSFQLFPFSTDTGNGGRRLCHPSAANKRRGTAVSANRGLACLKDQWGCGVPSLSDDALVAPSSIRGWGWRIEKNQRGFYPDDPRAHPTLQKTLLHSFTECAGGRPQDTKAAVAFFSPFSDSPMSQEGNYDADE
ncbi:hypothetical protein JTE90_011297 [Oedothorax gibbosus]|uniref:Uncharacterized protein n=1 Tax=Oedothorax gibbosus TaxID=931172 RepID=A0AAV6VKP2_9ARAC|nr:hypothetical protein JTE90_011297 [Oedothorax gibbosus]